MKVTAEMAMKTIGVFLNQSLMTDEALRFSE